MKNIFFFSIFGSSSIFGSTLIFGFAIFCMRLSFLVLNFFVLNFFLIDTQKYLDHPTACRVLQKFIETTVTENIEMIYEKLKPNFIQNCMSSNGNHIIQRFVISLPNKVGEIIGIIQSIFNLLPNIELKETVDALNTKSDDSEFMIFISQLCRSVVALHDLVNTRHPPLGEKEKKEKFLFIKQQ